MEEESLFLKIDLEKLKKLHRDKANRRSKSRSSNGLSNYNNNNNNNNLISFSKRSLITPIKNANT